MRTAMRHAEGSRPRHSADAMVEPVNRRDPGDVYIRQEIELDRRIERWIWVKAGMALMLVAGLVVIREVFFV